MPATTRSNRYSGQRTGATRAASPTSAKPVVEIVSLRLDSQVALITGFCSRRKRQSAPTTRKAMIIALAAAVTGAEGAEGTLAFVQKRKPNWAQ